MNNKNTEVDVMQIGIRYLLDKPILNQPQKKDITNIPPLENSLTIGTRYLLNTDKCKNQKKSEDIIKFGICLIS